MLDLPGPDAPGYLGRQRSIMLIQQELVERPGVASLDHLVSFILPFIEEPEDREKAKELLYLLSQAQLTELLESLVSSSVPPKD